MIKIRGGFVKKRAGLIIGNPEGGGLNMTGYIYVKNRVEGEAVLKFQLCDASGAAVKGDYTRDITFISRFPKGYRRLIPVFQRVTGDDSNSVYHTGNGVAAYPESSVNASETEGRYAKSYKETGIRGEYIKPVRPLVNKYEPNKCGVSHFLEVLQYNRDTSY